MARFRVRFDPRAKREFRRVPAQVRDRFYAVFGLLEEDPFRSRPGCDIRVVHGVRAAHAVRVGEYRGVYDVIGTTIWFSAFGHRSTVYR